MVSPDRRKWFEEMIERYEKPLMAYACRMLRNLDDAREAVQETFLKLWKAGPARIEGREAPWLFTVCRNRAIDGIRKEKNMKPVDAQSLAERPNGKPGPAEIAEVRQQKDQLLDELSRLPENQKEVLVLKFQQGLSYKEISQITGHSVSNVGFLIHAGMLALRARLG